MKPNSCLFDALKVVVQNQFLLDISQDEYAQRVFDKYNEGNGIPSGYWVRSINEALSGYSIEVEAIYGNIIGEFPNRELIRTEKEVPPPCIVLVENGKHAKPLLPGKSMNCNAAITLRRSNA